MKENIKLQPVPFFIVIDKVAEADFFLECLKGCDGMEREFRFYLSAFVTALRSTTFVLQKVMSGVPGFSEWYEKERVGLGESPTAKFLHELRNKVQKEGHIPFRAFAQIIDGEYSSGTEFLGWSRKKIEPPSGDIQDVCLRGFLRILNLLYDCYRRFYVFVDESALGSEKGLNALGWTIRDIEKMKGLPEGWLGSVGDGETENVLNAEREFQFEDGDPQDEDTVRFFQKYRLVQ